MEIATTGEYICTNFKVINKVVLTVVHKQTIYRYRKIKISFPITKIQNNEGGFTGKN
jgi:hypothetical protein